MWIQSSKNGGGESTEIKRAATKLAWRSTSKKKCRSPQAWNVESKLEEWNLVEHSQSRSWLEPQEQPTLFPCAIQFPEGKRCLHLYCTQATAGKPVPQTSKGICILAAIHSNKAKEPVTMQRLGCCFSVSLGLFSLVECHGAEIKWGSGRLSSRQQLIQCMSSCQETVFFVRIFQPLSGQQFHCGDVTWPQKLGSAVAVRIATVTQDVLHGSNLPCPAAPVTLRLSSSQPHLLAAAANSATWPWDDHPMFWSHRPLRRILAPLGH